MVILRPFLKHSNIMNKYLFFIAACFLPFTLANAQTEILVGGNMEAVNLWQRTTLNTAAGSMPEATWNHTNDAPTAGVGGNLHVKGKSISGESQYCIYQQITLSSDKLYTFDGAFKAIAINNSWCEVFIGTEPVDGEDYGDGQFRLAALGTWAAYDQDDGIFSINIDSSNYRGFAPPTSGDYFFVLKIGSTSSDSTAQAYDVIVDELTLIEERAAPITDFSVDFQNGFVPLTVQFTDESAFAQSWSWNFGDGSALSTEQNPSHTYTTPSIYTVTLSTTNELGTTELIKTDYIAVYAVERLTAGGVIVGGEMNDSTKWSTSDLNTAAGHEAVVVWNDTDHTPAAGRNGALYVTGLSNNSTVQFAIYQKVTLSRDSVYRFDAAMMDFTADLDRAWYEVFIGLEPVAGEDYTRENQANFLLSEFNTSSNECDPKGINGTFMLDACANNLYNPPEDGDYYFVLKMGTNSIAGNDMPFQLGVDEISLTSGRATPLADFSADKVLGFAPLTVQFTDLSTFGSILLWDFGDGTEKSTDRNPVHVYENVGTYSVSLIVYNELGITELEKTDYITAIKNPDAKADFLADITEGEAPLLVYFTNLSTNATSWAWNFGDGGTSVEQSPSHTYTVEGVYTVSLAATNEVSTDILVVEDLITVGAAGIDNLENDVLTVYPNPSSGLIQISLPGLTLENVIIYDITGKRVKLDNPIQTLGTISVTLNTEGIYFVQIHIDDQVLIKKIIIRK